jgi:hypothetical protein
MDHNDTYGIRSMRGCVEKAQQVGTISKQTASPHLALPQSLILGRSWKLERQGWKPSAVRRARSVLERMLKECYPAAQGVLSDLLIFGWVPLLLRTPGAGGTALEAGWVHSLN